MILKKYTSLQLKFRLCIKIYDWYRQQDGHKILPYYDTHTKRKYEGGRKKFNIIINAFLTREKSFFFGLFIFQLKE